MANHLCEFKKVIYYVINLLIRSKTLLYLPQNGPISSPIHHHSGLYFHNNIHYEILKEH